MISLKRLIMNPASPDRAIQQAFHESEGALARIAHVNRLSRDIMDVKFYELDLDLTSTLRISSKKGIVELVNADPLVTTISIGLQNEEIIPDHDKFYIQLSVYSNNYSVTPIIIGRGYAGDTFSLQIKNLDAAADWGLLYFYYDMIKID